MAELEATDDEQMQLKKRARRRLVGAAALALLAVIVLPMVMDEEPKPLTQEVLIRIPSQDSTAPAARLAAPAPEEKPAPAEAKAEPKAEEAPPAPPKAAEEAKPAAAASAKPEPKPADKPEPKTVAKAEAKPVEPAAKTEAKHETEQWVVQLGAYQDPGNVRVLLAKIKELGYPAYTEKVDTGQGVRTRVRAGPFATREKAEKAQAGLRRISAGGPTGGVVAPK